MLSNELKYLNVANKVEINQTKEFKNCNFQYIFLNWIISIKNGTNLTKLETCIAECHSEGTVSQIFYLGPSSNFVECRKFSCKKY